MDSSWQARTKVLCFFRYWGSQGQDTVTFDDAIMIEVEFRDQIADEFDLAVVRARKRGWGVGPMPKRWILTSYLPQRPLVASVRDLH